jgi:endonuclease-8
MEGPSLYLAAAQLKPFIGKRIGGVRGNTTIAKERLEGETVRNIFAWGKHLVLQCDAFALRVHFLLFGSFEAEVEGTMVTGDYTRPRVPRLALTFPNGELRLFTCSVRFIEGRNVKRTYDFAVDIMSKAWDPKLALAHLKDHDQEQIADVLLDQTMFAGVGNIIKNEVLWLARAHPEALVRRLSVAKRKAIIAQARAFSLQFLAWRKVFALKKNLRIHRRSTCPNCGGPVTHKKTGERKRMSHYCPRCQTVSATRAKRTSTQERRPHSR